MKASVITLGCKINQCESESIATILEGKGYAVENVETNADLFVVNTCAVTAEAERKSRQTVRRLAKKYPDCRIVAGKHAAAVFEKPSARRMMRELDQKVAASEGVTDYEDLIDRLSVDLTVEDGDSIDTGAFVFEAIALPGHTKCSFGYFCRSLGLLLGAETLGVYDGASEVLPAYLVGYQMALASIERVLSLAPKAILVPHYGLLEGALAKRYLSRSRKSAEETALWIFTELSKGVSEQEIVKAYRERVYHGYIRTIYPVDAMELNTGIMVSLIRRELMPDQG